MFATGETVGLAEWITDDTCLVHDCNSLGIFQYFRSKTAKQIRRNCPPVKALCGRWLKRNYFNYNSISSNVIHISTAKNVLFKRDFSRV